MSKDNKTSESDSVESSASSQYDVTELIGRDVDRHGIMYKVLWTDFPLEEATWSYEEDLRQTCPLLVDAYEVAHPRSEDPAFLKKVDKFGYGKLKLKPKAQRRSGGVQTRRRTVRGMSSGGKVAPSVKYNFVMPPIEYAKAQADHAAGPVVESADKSLADKLGSLALGKEPKNVTKKAVKGDLESSVTTTSSVSTDSSVDKPSDEASLTSSSGVDNTEANKSAMSVESKSSPSSPGSSGQEKKDESSVSSDEPAKTVEVALKTAATSDESSLTSSSGVDTTEANKSAKTEESKSSPSSPGGSGQEKKDVSSVSSDESAKTAKVALKTDPDEVERKKRKAAEEKALTEELDREWALVKVTKTDKTSSDMDISEDSMDILGGQKKSEKEVKSPEKLAKSPDVKEKSDEKKEQSAEKLATNTSTKSSGGPKKGKKQKKKRAVVVEKKIVVANVLNATNVGLAKLISERKDLKVMDKYQAGQTIIFEIRATESDVTFEVTDDVAEKFFSKLVVKWSIKQHFFRAL